MKYCPPSRTDSPSPYGPVETPHLHLSFHLPPLSVFLLLCLCPYRHTRRQRVSRPEALVTLLLCVHLSLAALQLILLHLQFLLLLLLLLLLVYQLLFIFSLHLQLPLHVLPPPQSLARLMLGKGWVSLTPLWAPNRVRCTHSQGQIPQLSLLILLHLFKIPLLYSLVSLVIVIQSSLTLSLICLQLPHTLIVFLWGLCGKETILKMHTLYLITLIILRHGRPRFAVYPFLPRMRQVHAGQDICVSLCGEENRCIFNSTRTCASDVAGTCT